MFTSVQSKTFNQLTSKASSIGFQIPGYRAFIAESDQDKEKAYRLRHEVYCKELKWVAESDDGLEFDEFDSNAILVCVENDQQQIVGTIRVLDSQHEWLAEKYFSNTLSEGIDSVKKLSAVEVSRNTVLPEFRQKKLTESGITVLDLLFTMVMECGWNMMQRKNVLVTANPVMSIVLRRRGGAMRQIGPLVNMDDGTKVASYMMDTEIWRDTFKQRHLIIKEDHDCKATSSVSLIEVKSA
jgi:N-acyl-L-homoserine lactone synthetase